MKDTPTYLIKEEDVKADIETCDTNIRKGQDVIKNATEYITEQEIEKEKLLGILSYLQKRGVSGRPLAAGKLDFGSSFSPPTISKRGKEYGETTIFIKSLIKDKRTVSTKEIMSVFAKRFGGTVSEVSKNVSRTLGRLKDAGIIDNPVTKKGGTRGGRVWHYVEK